MSAGAPPNWPPGLPPPDAPSWVRAAVGWLFDLVPGEYRAYEVLRRYPILLARLAGEQVAAATEAARRGWRGLRADLAGELPPDVLEAALRVYELEGRRLAVLARQVAAVTDALAGHRRPPRL